MRRSNRDKFKWHRSNLDILESEFSSYCNNYLKYHINILDDLEILKEFSKINYKNIFSFAYGDFYNDKTVIINELNNKKLINFDGQISDINNELSFDHMLNDVNQEEWKKPKSPNDPGFYVYGKPGLGKAIVGNTKYNKLQTLIFDIHEALPKIFQETFKKANKDFLTY